MRKITRTVLPAIFVITFLCFAADQSEACYIDPIEFYGSWKLDLEFKL